MANMSEPDYKALFEEALFHLRCVMASRNSFTEPVTEFLMETLPTDVHWRIPEVEKIQEAALDFLRKHPQ